MTTTRSPQPSRPPQRPQRTPDPQQRGPERFVQASAADDAGSPGRAALAGLALLALVVGVPVLLLVFTGPPPYPTGLPDRSTLTQPIGVELLLSILLLVVWLAWLQFAVSVVLETISFVRGGGLPRALPFGGPSQAMARALVGTLLVGTSVLGSTGAAVAAAPVDAGQGGVAVSQAVQQADQQAEQAQQQAAQEAQEDRGPQMRPVAGVPADMTDVIGHKVAIVNPPDGHYHDNLWDIAERHLGDGRRWKEIFSLNENRQQPDGQQLVLGRLIQPGWVLIMPNDATGLDRVTEAPAPDQTTAPSGGGSPAAPATGAVDGVETQAAAEASSTLSRDLTGAGLLGAAVLASLLLERRRRRGRADLDAAELDAEVALRVGADLDRVAWLDEALRSLSGACRANGTPLPPVYSVRVSDDQIELLIAGEAHEDPAGWSAGGDSRRWVLRRDQPLPPERGHAPYPGLVCVGRDDDGRDVLIDLEAADGIVAVGGSSAIAREVVSALAVQLATAPWADDRRIVGHDLGGELAGIGQHRVELVDDLAAAVAELEGSGVRAPAPQVLSGRLGRSPGQAPRYLVAGSGLPDDLAERLVGGHGSRGLGVLVAGTPRASRWRAGVDDSGRLTLPLLGVDVDAVRLGSDSAELLRDLFEESRTREPADDGGRPPVPPTPTGDDATWRTARARVCVLGSLAVIARGEMDRARLPLAQEVVTFLALQAEPVHPSVLGASVWPLGVTPDVRDATLDRVRDWLGTDEEGSYLLRQGDDGRLALAPGVGVDWHAFCSLVRRSREVKEKEEGELLRRALQLVRGPLLDGVPSRRYSWLARTRLVGQSEDLVVDAALRLAQLGGDDPSGVTPGIEIGLRLAPTSQSLWRALLRAESAGDAGRLPATADRMVRVLGTQGLSPDAETTALLDELMPARGGDRPA